MKTMELQRIIEKMIPILKRADIRKAAVFGSFVRGNQTHESDIDLLVEYPKNATLFDVAQLRMTLEDTIGRRVDLVGYKTVKQSLKQQILSNQVQIL